MAEVSRNRTDRSTRSRPTGFEVLGEHQPACTSVLILNGLLLSVNEAVHGWWGFTSTAIASCQHAMRYSSGQSPVLARL